jgi:hypothetical protein
MIDLMKLRPVFGCALVLILAQSFAKAADAPAVAEPPDLAAARTKYETALKPMQDNLNQAIKTRVAKYVTDLDALERQSVTDGRVNGLEGVRAEHDAYAGGKGTVGFPESAKNIPSSARELRRAYDRDVTQLRSNAANAARAAYMAYNQLLDDCERKYVAARNADGLLAVRKEKQGIKGETLDPLNHGASAVAGDWVDSGGMKFSFHEDGNLNALQNGQSVHGTWVLDEAGKRKLSIIWDAGKGRIDYQLLPDGLAMLGQNLKKEWKTLVKQ